MRQKGQHRYRLIGRRSHCLFYTGSCGKMVVSAAELHAMRVAWLSRVTEMYICLHISHISGGSSIGRTRRTPPPLLDENIAFSCIFWNKVKLTPLFSAKMWLTPPPLAHSGSATAYIHINLLIVQRVLFIKPDNTDIFLYKPWRQKSFFNLKSSKCLSWPFPLHLNTYVMGLRPYLNPFIAVIDFSLTSIDVRF